VKMTVRIGTSLNTESVNKKVTEAGLLAMRNIVVLIANHAVQNSPWRTGNNRRSIHYGVSGMPHQRASSESPGAKDSSSGADESLVEGDRVQGAVYSTSGYGGFLETGTSKMRAQPYIKPGLDLYFTNSRFSEEMRKYLE